MLPLSVIDIVEIAVYFKVELNGYMVHLPNYARLYVALMTL